MEDSGVNSATTSTSNQHHRSRRYNNGNNHNFDHSHSPLSTFFKYTGISRTRSSDYESSDDSINSEFTQNNHSEAGDNNYGQVSIRIISGEEHDHRDEIEREQDDLLSIQLMESESTLVIDDAHAHAHAHGDSQNDNGVSIVGNSRVLIGNVDVEASDNGHEINNSRDSSNERHEINQAVRWIEQILPFSVLLLLVFIRQHLLGFLVTIWLAAFMFKSNEILRQQTALKAERKILVLTSVSLLFTTHIAAVYWWFHNDDLLYPLLMIPPKTIPTFWHAIFIIVVNDILVRQAAMVLKCFILMYYKNSNGLNYRKQGQMLTLLEYFSLLYRALLPTAVWYRFLLNKEYGSLFSSLITGLYLTLKLTSYVEKVQLFLSALKALSHREIHYGTYATPEQVNVAGEICAICQEKLHDPVVLHCKHIFCEDCVSEWLERERTCPLCRAVVKLGDVKSFADGSTSLFFQLF